MKRISIIAIILLTISTVPLSGMKRKHGEIVPQNHQVKAPLVKDPCGDAIDPSVFKKNRLADDKFSWDELATEIQLFVVSFVINVEDLERAIRSKNIDDTRAKLKQYTILKSLSRNTANLVDDIFGRRPCDGNHIIYFLMKNKSWLKGIFLSAAKSGNLCTLKLLCDNGFIEIAQDNEKLLIAAIGYGKIKFCKHLIERKMVTKVENAPLIYAIILQDIYAVKDLIESTKNEGMLLGKYTEIMVAAAVGNLNIFKLFLPYQHRGVTAIGGYNYLTNLQCAAANGHVEVVSICLLITNNYNCPKYYYDEDHNRFDALAKAIHNNHIGVVAFLLLKQIDVNRFNAGIVKDLPAKACRKGKAEIVELLLNSDVDCFCNKDIDEYTPLDYACAGGFIKITKLLVKHVIGLGRVKQYSDQFEKSLRVAIDYGHIEIVKWLVSKKVNINVEDEDGLNAADHAAGYPEILEFLLANGGVQTGLPVGYIGIKNN